MEILTHCLHDNRSSDPDILPTGRSEEVMYEALSFDSSDTFRWTLRARTLLVLHMAVETL